MSAEDQKLKEESTTVQLMIKKYCHAHHGQKAGLCVDCSHLLQYAHQRLLHCRFGKKKPFCSQCPVHCYRPDMRKRIRTAMRYSGPRMLFSHPKMAIKHLMTRFRKPTLSDLEDSESS